MVDLNPTKSVITLKVNELNTPIKRQRISDLIAKQKSKYILLKRDLP